jgi:hypothetical protein
MSSTFPTPPTVPFFAPPPTSQVQTADLQQSPTAGRKYDSGKPEYGLIPPHALDELAKVLTVGANKYDRENWKYVPEARRRYFDAMQRHLWAWKRGEIYDPETGLHHLSHAAACIFFLYEHDAGHVLT